MAGCAGEGDRWSVQSRHGVAPSWSKGVLWKPADVEEVTIAAARTDARCWIGGGALLAGIEIGGGVGLCSRLRRELRQGPRRSDAFELQQEASLRGKVAFGRVPEAEVADLVEAGGE